MVSWHVGHYTPDLLFLYKIEIIFFLLIIPPASQLSFNYSGFKQGDVNLFGDASIFRTELQVTANAYDQNNNYSVGRVTYVQQMHLWDKTSRSLTDFSTKFSFIIYSKENSYGDGLAFFLADQDLPFPEKTTLIGGGLGLVNGDHVLNSTPHSFVAVEFDTCQNLWDPNSLHVGLNLNTVKSIVTEDWAAVVNQRIVYDCSIEYNSTTHNLNVKFTGYEYDSSNEYNFITFRRISKYLSHKVDLREYLPEWVIVGFSAATGLLSEIHTIVSWSFSSSLDSQMPPTPISTAIPNPNPVRKRNIGLWVGLGVSIPVAMGLIGLVCFLLSKWKKTIGQGEELDYDLNMDDEFQKGSGPKKFIHDELVSATNNFSEAEKLGQGGFGGVYKGFLKGLNSHVAVKRISKESKQGIKEYATEVKIISQLRHKNLVQLIGWCHKKNDLLLVYEFMPNGSLDSHLYRRKRFMTWEVRYKIALDLASALLYLHEEWEQCVLHRDIKSSNIMLDSKFNAKLGDFGLARLVDHEKGSQTTLTAGTMGYMAPEYIATGKASKESDIYSFGVVLLEIASGSKPIDHELKEGQMSTVEWVWELYGRGKFVEAADPKLCGVFDKQQMERLVVVGIWCAHPEHSSRPSARQVIHVLNFEAPLPMLSQRKCLCQPTFLQQYMKCSIKLDLPLRVHRNRKWREAWILIHEYYHRSNSSM